MLPERSFKCFSGNHYSYTKGEVQTALKTMFEQHGFKIDENVDLLMEMLQALSEDRHDTAQEVAGKFARNVGVEVYRVGVPNSSDGHRAMFTYQKNDQTWLIQMYTGKGCVWTEPKGRNE